VLRSAAITRGEYTVDEDISAIEEAREAAA
jgi:hypothetical protein